MNEVEWVQHVAGQLANQPWLGEDRLSVQTGLKLAYGSEIVSDGPERETHIISFETDLALTEEIPTVGGGRALLSRQNSVRSPRTTRSLIGFTDRFTLTYGTA